jgi:hypothetical protein
MAIWAICCPVGSKQRKATGLVNPCYVADKPWIRSMATGTIETGCSLMDIHMAFIALWFRLGEYKRCMALTAACCIMLAGKNKFCLVMVKWVYSRVELPSIWTVTGAATHLKIRTMWWFGLLTKEEHEQEK